MVQKRIDRFPVIEFRESVFAGRRVMSLAFSISRFNQLDACHSTRPVKYSTCAQADNVMQLRRPTANYDVRRCHS